MRCGVLVHVVGDDASVAEYDTTICIGRQNGVVSHEDEGGTLRFIEIQEEFKDCGPVDGIEIASRLVSQNDRRPQDEGSGKSDALLLAA